MPWIWLWIESITTRVKESSHIEKEESLLRKKNRDIIEKEESLLRKKNDYWAIQSRKESLLRKEPILRKKIHSEKEESTIEKEESLLRKKNHYWERRITI